MITKIKLDWIDIKSNHRIIEGVTIIESYTKGCFLFCNSDVNKHYINIKYNKTLIDRIYCNDNVICIICRDEAKFFSNKFKYDYVTFEINTEFLELNIVY